MAEPGSDAAWEQAMELAAAVYRLAASMTAPESRLLAERLVSAAVNIPTHLSEESTRAFHTALAQTRTLLRLAVRLGYLTQPAIAPSLAALDQLTSGGHAPLPTAPTPGTSDKAVAARAPSAPEPPTPNAQRPTSDPSRSTLHAPRSTGTDRLLIDGCNFLGRAPGYMLGSDKSRDELLFRLQEYGRQHPAHRITLFYDGRSTSTKTVGGIEVRVTSGGRPADDVIVQFIGELPPADLPRSTLATDDRDLAARARSQGVKVEGVSWLHGKLVRKQPAGNGRKEGVGRSQIDEWVDFFNKPPQRPGK